VASDWVGQFADEFDATWTETEGGDAVSAPAPVGDEPELDVLLRMADDHVGCALVLEALERVASRRDQAILLELAAQGLAGDPSPARTVAAHHGVSTDVVRQAACRVRNRLNRLAADDRHFAGLADLPIVA
jgi:hypothetical protein